MSTPAASAGTGVPSPCVNVCRMNAATGLCEGCARTLDEIAAWAALDDAARRAVWQRIGERRASGAAPPLAPAPSTIAGAGAAAVAPKPRTIMKRIVFWFDVISPFAYLAFERLPQALEGCSYEVQYRPVLFAGLLNHWGQKGPAEIEPKRAWTFRHVAWFAHAHGIEMQPPKSHPFNPLALLRLALACCPDETEMPNRHVVERLMHHVWHGGAEATDPARLAALTQDLAPPRDPAGDAVKAQLRALTDSAIAKGLFGVPTFELEDGRVFWGLDALPMLRAALQGDAWFDGPQWQEAGAPRAGVSRSSR